MAEVFHPNGGNSRGIPIIRTCLSVAICNRTSVRDSDCKYCTGCDVWESVVGLTRSGPESNAKVFLAFQVCGV